MSHFDNRKVEHQALRFGVQAFAWLGFLLFVTAAASGNEPSVVAVYEQRLPVIRDQVPALVESAEAAAKRVLADPRTSLALPSFNRAGEFANELTSRAGGLAKAPANVKGKGIADKCIVLVSVRNWETDASAVVPKLKEYRAKGYLVTVFGSRAGQPTNAVADFFIDNGAASGATNHGPVNIMANVTLGWMWCCEYAAALSRHGKHPGILRTKALSDGPPHNKFLQNPDGRVWLGDTDKPVAAGTLSGLYLDRVARLLRDVRSPAIQGSLADAATLAAKRLRQGKTVQFSGIGHIVDSEMLRHGLRSPVRVCRPDQIEKGVGPGDLLVWFGYMGCVGLKSKGNDTLECLREKQVDVVLCEAPLPSGGDTAPDVLTKVLWNVLEPVPWPSPVILLIDQSWAMPDAEVPIPWPPGRMAPVSGLNALLLLRMLDEEICARLPAKSSESGPRP